MMCVVKYHTTPATKTLCPTTVAISLARMQAIMKLGRFGRRISEVKGTFFSCPLLFARSFSVGSDRLLDLSNLRRNDGAFKKRRRIGRGMGGRGKTSGHGHGGNGEAQSTPRGFEGGQTPLYKTMPKIGFYNFMRRDIQTVNLDKIAEFIQMGRLKPKEDFFITMRDLYACGLLSNYDGGVKLLSRGKDEFSHKIHLEVSMASANAIAAVEKSGGTVTCVHFNRLALRALIKPYKFDILPRRARPPPKIMDYYLDRTKAGYLSPEIQARNLKLFGALTSEDALRADHDQVMRARRKLGLVKFTRPDGFEAAASSAVQSN